LNPDAFEPLPTDQLAGFADLAMGEGLGERAKGKAKKHPRPLRGRALSRRPGEARRAFKHGTSQWLVNAVFSPFGTLSHKWERGTT